MSDLGMGLKIKMEKRELIELVKWVHSMGRMDATATNIKSTDAHLLKNVVDGVTFLADHTYNADPPLDTRLKKITDEGINSRNKVKALS
tara:strand:- start:380 stop:646 length:267 start_codon:yes stop_codon:yes gene_type:complete